VIPPTAVQANNAIDKSGSDTSNIVATDQSQWTVSSSGSITLQRPINGVTLKSGDTIRGISSTETVQYRLEDNRLGVIAQGSLSVVGGKFSGILQFNSKDTTGVLSVFTFDQNSGAEINHADINVKFAQ
jgi:hypothetical protein